MSVLSLLLRKKFRNKENKKLYTQYKMWETHPASDKEGKKGSLFSTLNSGEGN